MSGSQKIKIELKFTYEFNSKDWDSHAEHMDQLEEDINQKLQFDSLSTFHHLNDIVYPDSSFKVIVK